jgi:hypothetical protein
MPRLWSLLLEQPHLIRRSCGLVFTLASYELPQGFSPHIGHEHNALRGIWPLTPIPRGEPLALALPQPSLLFAGAGRQRFGVSLRHRCVVASQPSIGTDQLFCLKPRIPAIETWDSQNTLEDWWAT